MPCLIAPRKNAGGLRWPWFRNRESYLLFMKILDSYDENQISFMVCIMAAIWWNRNSYIFNHDMPSSPTVQQGKLGGAFSVKLNYFLCSYLTFIKQSHCSISTKQLLLDQNCQKINYDFGIDMDSQTMFFGCIAFDNNRLCKGWCRISKPGLLNFYHGEMIALLIVVRCTFQA